MAAAFQVEKSPNEIEQKESDACKATPDHIQLLGVHVFFFNDIIKHSCLQTKATAINKWN